MISITHGSLEPGPKNIKNCTNSTNISAFLRNSARYGSPSGLGSTFGIETNICHDVGTASAGRTFRTHGWVPLHQPWRCRKLTEDACGILYHDNFTKRKQGCWGSFILLTIISNHIQSYPIISNHIQSYPIISNHIQSYPSSRCEVVRYSIQGFSQALPLLYVKLEAKSKGTKVSWAWRQGENIERIGGATFFASSFLG